MPSLSALLLDGRALLDADRILRAGLAERRASFELSIGRLPAQTGFAVIAGLETFLARLGQPVGDTAGLSAAQRAVGFSDALAVRLSAAGSLRVDVDAVPDGTVAFAETPLVTVEGPFLEAALVGPLLRHTVERGVAGATRAARLHQASGGEPILDGSSAHVLSAEAALALGRAAYVGGASATTSAFVATQLSIPFRGMGTLELGTLVPPVSSEDDLEEGWGESVAGQLLDLGAGDDDEALLLESKRLGLRASGWVARGLGNADPGALAVRYDLVAIEEEGAWAPRRGREGVIPGRKRVVRYTDQGGRAVADVVHLASERMTPPRALGAVTLTPLTRAVMRGGHLIEAPEAASVGRERALGAQQGMPGGVLRLRGPEGYRVELSEGVLAMRGV